MHEIVQDYYGHQLQHTDDLKTNACCDTSQIPAWLKPLLSRIHPEVLSRYYGCGLVCPPLLEGCRVLDLGCGSGRDVYLLSQLVGPTGEVVGVDMTNEQLTIARKHQELHSNTFGYSNVSFLQGYIEHLDEVDLEPGSFDVIVSNCVINLSLDKDEVLSGIHRLLKDGGEFYFSDVYADRQGFTDPRLITDQPLTIKNSELASRIGSLRFFSATYRLFKLEGLETSCEDYGQAVIYSGNIPGHTDRFVLDKHHNIEAGKVFPVCGNTWRMLHDTRFATHFNFVGDFTRHFGIFPGCGSALPFDTILNTKVISACC